MATGTMSSRVLGLVRDILLSALFPTRVTDAFLAAFQVPNKLRRILGEGSLSVSMIPVYIENQELHGEKVAKELAGSLWVMLSLVAATISVVAIIFMDQIIPMIVSGAGFSEIPGKIELTVSLAKILFAYLFLVTSYAFFMGIANAHKYFLIPAMGPTLFNFIFILFALFSSFTNQLDGTYLAYGVLVGGLFQFLLVFVFLLKKSLVPKFKLNLQAKGLWTVLKNMLPGILGFGVVQILSLINIKFASSLAEGTVSYIYYADRLLELPQSIIAISLGTALLPTLSQLFTEKNMTEFIKTSEKYQSLLVYLSVPCCVGLYVLAEPIVVTIFQRGHIGASDVAGIVSILQIYSFLLLAMCLNKVLIPNLYAIKNTWLPAVIALVTLSLHVFMAPYWMEAMGLRGLIISTTIAGFLNMTLVYISSRVLVGQTSIAALLTSLLKSTSIAAVMGGVLFYLNQMLAFSSFNQLMRILVLLGLVVFGVVIYFGLSKALKLKEFKESVQLLKR